MSDSIQCPFCPEKDFDLIGLKRHLMRGWCVDFEQTDAPPEPVISANQCDGCQRGLPINKCGQHFELIPLTGTLPCTKERADAMLSARDGDSHGS
jgi:hypothetical protein